MLPMAQPITYEGYDVSNVSIDCTTFMEQPITRGGYSVSDIYADDLALCVDCTMLIANGELLGDATEIEITEHYGAIDRKWSGDYHLVVTCTGDGDCDPFSRTPCNGCGSRLAGERHKGAALTV